MLTDSQISILGTIASIAGLGLTLLAYLRIRGLSRQIAAQSIRRTLFVLFEDVDRIPVDKTTLLKKAENDVSEALVYTESFFVSRFPWKHGDRKKIIKKIRSELAGSRNPQNLKRDFRLLRDDIFVIKGE